MLARTETVRNAFKPDNSSNATKPFSPELSIPIPRISQVVFSSDEKHLVICAESGGGLAVYEVDGLMNDNKEPSFQLPTQGLAIRALLPNPSLDSAHLFALVLSNGQLMLANLAARQLEVGPDGPVLKEGVSCVSWSAKGRQLVAGMGDGTALQLKQDGQVQAQIPRPPYMDGDQHGKLCILRASDSADHVAVSSILWLANEDFFIIYTPTVHDPETTPESALYLVLREKATTRFNFHRFADNPSPAFGMNRYPPHHFIQRLREFPPSLADMLVVSSSASADIGMITKSTTPLSSDTPVTNAYTNTSVAKDEYRASLPYNDEEMSETSPIGMVLDLSSKEKIKRPIRAEEEFGESPTPLPALLVLNNEGILSGWWVLYHESIRAKTGFPGLVALQSQSTPNVASQEQPSQFKMPATPAMQSSAFPSGLPKPAGATFGSPGLQGGSFGGAAPLGQRSSPWGSPAGAATSAQTAGASFGKPAFGSTGMIGAAPGSSFGAFGGIGTKPSPWATQAANSPPTGTQTGQNAFGGSAAAPSPFAKFSGGNQASSPFSSFGGNSGFGSLGKPGTSAFAATTPGNSFGLKTEPSSGSTITVDSGTMGSSGKLSSWTAPSAFGTPAQTQSTFGQPPSSFVSVSRESDMDDADDAVDRERSEATPTPQERPALGAGAEGFKLGSTFKGDDSAKDDAKKPERAPTFEDEGSAKDDAKIAESPLTFKDDGSAKYDAKKPESTPSFVTTFGGTKDGAKKSESAMMFGSSFGIALDGLKKTEGARSFGTTLGSAFGSIDNTNSTSRTKEPDKEREITPKPFTLFGERKSTDTQSTPGSGLFSVPSSSAAKSKLEDAPLPPDFTKSSKSTTGKDEDAPLPPDFTRLTKIKPDEEKDASPSATTQSDLTKATPKAKEDDVPLPPAPLPPDFAAKPLKSKEEEDFPPLAGSPPIKIEAPDSVPASPIEGDTPTSKRAEEFPQLEEEDEEDLGQDDSEEGLDQDEVNEPEIKEEDETGHSILTNAPQSRTPQWSFGQTPRSMQFPPPAPSPPALMGTPGPQKSSVPSATPFGFPKPQPHFPPPTSRLQETPRSPSPVRSASTPLGVRRQAVPSAQPVSRPVGRPVLPVESELTGADLDDNEDELIRAELAAPVPASKKLEPFLAHQDYAGKVSKTGIAGQIERVYRDINSMVDTLGLNARTLASFVRGQTELLPERGRSLDDLDEVVYNDATEDWCLVEIEDLQMLENDLEKSLESGRLADVPSILADMNGLQVECSRLRSRVSALRREFDADRGDPEALARNAPLSAEQISQQKALRAGFTELQKNLREAEDGAVLLRTRLAAAQAGAGNGRRPTATPTVEAVTNTIMKMTRMIEQKSGDIDLLESQMRRMRPAGRETLSASLANLSLDGAQGDEKDAVPLTPKRVPGAWAPDDSPFVTPPSSRRLVGKTFGYYTPDSKSDSSSPAVNGSHAKRPAGRADGGGGSGGLDEETIGLYVERARRRREVRDRLEVMLAEKGTRVTRASGDAVS